MMMELGSRRQQSTIFILALLDVLHNTTHRCVFSCNGPLLRSRKKTWQHCRDILFRERVKTGVGGGGGGGGGRV